MGVEQYFSEEDRQELAEMITEIEEQTSGEIRVKIVDSYDPEVFDTIEDRAITEFLGLGMHDTRDKTGVLIYVALDDRQFHIVADQGINEKFPKYFLNNHAEMMSSDFKKGNFKKGLESMLRYVGAQLINHFPPREDDINELPNDIIVGDGK